MMAAWDRNECDVAVTSLRKTVEGLVGDVARLEHKIGHLLECFRAAGTDDTEMWSKHYKDLRIRFEALEQRLKTLEGKHDGPGGNSN